MMKALINLLLGLFTFMLFNLPLIAQDHSQLKFNCSLCHACETPTKSNPCLIVCPREKMMTVYISPANSPAIIKMNKLKSVQDLYEPVVFSHRIHAEMSEMSGGCEMCHHYNPPGDVVGCDNCHEPKRQRTDISKPDLKGAYHRQCLDCHSQWSDDATCESCHELNESGKSAFTGKDYQQTRVHPEIKVPAKLVLNTTYEKGKPQLSSIMSTQIFLVLIVKVVIRKKVALNVIPSNPKRKLKKFLLKKSIKPVQVVTIPKRIRLVKIVIQQKRRLHSTTSQEPDLS
jgi:hypothetical protein